MVLSQSLGYLWYVPPKRVWFLGLFGLKTGIHSAIILSGIIGYRSPSNEFDGLLSVMVFETTTG